MSVFRHALYRAPAPQARYLAALALLAHLAWAAPVQAQAVPEPLFLPYAGAGNLVLFDPATGSGGWVGSIDAVDGAPGGPVLPLVSVVLFSYDAMTQSLSGSFEFTSAASLGASLFGTLVGSTVSANPFTTGAQFEIDYTITGGTGAFAGASGFALAFLQYDPLAGAGGVGSLNNYAEDGALVLSAVPEPDSLALVLLGGLSLALALRARPPAVARRGRPGPGRP